MHHKSQPSSVTIFSACKKNTSIPSASFWLLPGVSQGVTQPSPPRHHHAGHGTSWTMLPGPRKVWFLPGHTRFDYPHVSMWNTTVHGITQSLKCCYSFSSCSCRLTSHSAKRLNLAVQYILAGHLQCPEKLPAVPLAEIGSLRFLQDIGPRPLASAL